MPAWSIERYEVVDSTQDVARQRLVEGRVVVAGWQRRGRGRYGRSWNAPPGQALLTSVVLRPVPAIAPILPLLAGVAVHEAITASAAVEAELKWPNDVLAAGKKVAGILVEHPPGPFAVLGIGINANLGADDLPDASATSLMLITGRPVDLGELLDAVLAHLDHWLAEATANGIGVIAHAWRDRSRMLGQPVELHLPDRSIRGIAEDITDSGALVLRSADGRRKTFIAGEVRRLRA